MAKRISGYERTAKRPVVGNWYVWELTKDHARELIQVVEVFWNGEEWWVWSLPSREVRAPEPLRQRPLPNGLNRFWEAVTPVGRQAVRTGPPRADEVRETEGG